MGEFVMFLYPPSLAQAPYRDRVRVRVVVPGWDQAAMRRYAVRRYREIRASQRQSSAWGVAGSVVTARAAVVGHLATMFDGTSVSVPGGPLLLPAVS